MQRLGRFATVDLRAKCREFGTRAHIARCLFRRDCRLSGEVQEPSTRPGVEAMSCGSVRCSGSRLFPKWALETCHHASCANKCRRWQAQRIKNSISGVLRFFSEQCLDRLPNVALGRWCRDSYLTACQHRSFEGESSMCLIGFLDNNLASLAGNDEFSQTPLEPAFSDTDSFPKSLHSIKKLRSSFLAIMYVRGFPFGNNVIESRDDTGSDGVRVKNACR